MAVSFLGKCSVAVEEAAVLVPYPDGRTPEGVTKFSQGFGHQDPRLTAGSPAITLEQAWAQFAEEFPPREKFIRNLMTVPMAQEHEDALVKAYFNIGNDIREVITLLNEAGPYQDDHYQESIRQQGIGNAMAKLLSFNRDEQGIFHLGLAERRGREVRCFLKGDYSLWDKPAPKLKLWRNLPLTEATVEYIDFPPEIREAA